MYSSQALLGAQSPLGSQTSGSLVYGWADNWSVVVLRSACIYLVYYCPGLSRLLDELLQIVGSLQIRVFQLIEMPTEDNSIVRVMTGGFGLCIVRGSWSLLCH